MDLNNWDQTALSREQCLELSRRALAGIDRLASLERPDHAAELTTAGAHIQLAVDILDGGLNA